MNIIRALLAAASITAILALGAVVAFAAPSAVARTASPSASAAHAVYCPAQEKNRRKQERDSFKKHMNGQRAAFFRSHKKVNARAAFTKTQKARFDKLSRNFKSCE
jgi:hypothetical protein